MLICHKTTKPDAIYIYIYITVFLFIIVFYQSITVCICVCTRVYHHHHDVRLARISLTLSPHVSLSFIAFGRSSGLHPVSSHSCCMNVRAGRPAFDWPYAGVRRSTSLTISSLLLQQCPVYLVRLACIVFVIGGRWPYSWRRVGVLLPGPVQYCSQHSCIIAVELLLQLFS